MSNFKFRSQRKTLLMLLVSAIILAFLINFLSALAFEQFRVYSWAPLLIVTLFLVGLVVILTPLLLTERASSLMKEMYIPIVIKLKKDEIKVIDVDDYFVSLEAKLAVDDIFNNNPILKQKFLDALKSKRKSESHRSGWDEVFLLNLAQYLVWGRYEVCISTDYYDRLEYHGDLRAQTTKMLFKDYPENLKSNLFITAFTSPERAPEKNQLDNGDVVSGGPYGEWLNPDFLHLRMPEGMKLVSGDLENGDSYLLFKGKFGQLKIEYDVSSLTVEGCKISLFTPEKLDLLRDRENAKSWQINLTVSLKLSRFASFRRGLEDFTRWARACFSELEEMDWDNFLGKIPHQQIRNLENKMQKILDILEQTKK